MPVEDVPHNRNNGVSGGIWRENGVIHKVLTRRRRQVPAEWSSSADPRHWNFWRREALAYRSGLPRQLGLGAPALLDTRETGEGDIELLLEDVEGRHSSHLSAEDLAETARALGRSQGRRDLPAYPWLSRGFLADYSTSRPADWSLLDDDRAWAQPLMEEHFPHDLRRGLQHLHRDRERLLSLMRRLPRTVCHLDVWPNNIVRRPDGEVTLLDWAFVGDGALGEDVGNLVPDSVFDLLLPHRLLDDLDARATRAYLAGLAEAGWTGDERLVRLGICASAVKYDWLTVRCLELASADQHLDYGGGSAVQADARYAARAAGLSLCVRWAREAEDLARELGFPVDKSGAGNCP
ncbi:MULTISPECIES: aminoglycoside phosphotransferase family protein [unclassified Streptomyces]|uniref:aminoglycoside phosphotransferase family protein n=1 Tax=unclassified Streptomyces TaxID=2593676 RepID=UPI001F1DCE63|nr:MULTISPECIES: aminoglycoside phosphotransferase family protein [unclassified Streptomyces]